MGLVAFAGCMDLVVLGFAKRNTPLRESGVRGGGEDPIRGVPTARLSPNRARASSGLRPQWEPQGALERGLVHLKHAQEAGHGGR